MTPDELRSTIARLRALGFSDARIAGDIPRASPQTVRRWMSRGEIVGHHEIELRKLLEAAEKANEVLIAHLGEPKKRTAPERSLPALEKVADLLEREGPLTTGEVAELLGLKVRDAHSLLEKLRASGSVQVRTRRVWSIKAPVDSSLGKGGEHDR